MSKNFIYRLTHKTATWYQADTEKKAIDGSSTLVLGHVDGKAVIYKLHKIVKIEKPPIVVEDAVIEQPTIEKKKKKDVKIEIK